MPAEDLGPFGADTRGAELLLRLADGVDQVIQ